ncbi:hypothetical protein [Brachyspira pilosicoli]|uniref:hypothetical protein n=1 Tax=Brachyspira pilosicoli TaxID=52584 RepID=UPI001CA4E263|nr:hypothetical protein [Brachyspira pilosicoli]MBW5382900.1 hypothetical protein [Brachyspira pilosicoli]
MDFFKSIVVFLLLAKISFGAFYFAPSTNMPSTNSTENKKPIIENNETLSSEYSIDTNSVKSIFEMKGTNIINQNGVISSSVIPTYGYKSHPFRYTEVTFILAGFLSYSYASLIVFGLDALENSFVQPSTSGRSRYKSLWISATIFEITAGVIFGATVAYDSYQRIYGKKKDGLSFSFVPYYEPFQNDAGFMFTLNYPYN